MGKASTRHAVFYDVCGGAIFDQVIHFMQIFVEEIASEDNDYSQFGIMCTYLMLFHFDEYDWSVQHHSSHRSS